MNYEMEEVIDKPEGWPANAIECQLENIQMQLDEFMKNPSYKNKEVLVIYFNIPAKTKENIKLAIFICYSKIMVSALELLNAVYEESKL